MKGIFMSNAKQKIAMKYAPVLSCELSKNIEQRIFDCFSSIDFKSGIDAWAIRDRVGEYRDMFSINVDEIKADIIPSIYYSLLETETHYFLLYTVYHALDQKSPFGHEHDMEHIQVVVRKNKEIVEYVTT